MTKLTTSKTTAEYAAKIRDIIGEPFDLCDVPAGEFLYGDDKQKLTLPDFAIAKYLITYSQFQTFIDAKDGFYDDRWWEGFAVEAKYRQQPGDQEWKIAHHPRENVSWYDAMAFCRWLSSRLGTGFDIDTITKWAVRLPTEFEWEKAARGTDGREYPYGNTFDKTKSNILESGIGKTTPVTEYPQGASPYGVMDMSGNVWEWCLTGDDTPALAVEKENIRTGGLRVLRGGSFINLQDFTRCAVRDINQPFNRNYDVLGFRVVVCP